MRFDEVVGYTELKGRLRQMRASGRVPHAQLFVGADGSGAFHLAWAFAAYLNCHEPTPGGEPCGHCPSCVKYKIAAHPDLLFLLPIVGGDKLVTDDYLGRWRELIVENPYFSHQDWLEKIKAGNSRPIIYSRESDLLEERMGFRISEAKWRVLMIWQPERMHEALANKLLKLIEEPPARTLILMVSIDSKKLMTTITSRTQRFDVPKRDEATLLEALREDVRFQDCEEGELKRAAHLAQGSYRTAQDFLDGKTDIGMSLDYFRRLINAITNTKELIQMKLLSEEVAKLGREEQIALLTYFSQFFRELYMYNLKIAELSYLMPEEEKVADKLLGVVTGRAIRSVLSELEKAVSDIGRNVSSRMVFFDLFLRLTAVLTPSLRGRNISL